MADLKEDKDEPPKPEVKEGLEEPKHLSDKALLQNKRFLGNVGNL